MWPRSLSAMPGPESRTVTRSATAPARAVRMTRRALCDPPHLIERLRIEGPWGPHVSSRSRMRSDRRPVPERLFSWRFRCPRRCWLLPPMMVEMALARLLGMVTGHGGHGRAPRARGVQPSYGHRPHGASPLPPLRSDDPDFYSVVTVTAQQESRLLDFGHTGSPCLLEGQQQRGLAADASRSSVGHFQLFVSAIDQAVDEAFRTGWPG